MKAILILAALLTGCATSQPQIHWVKVTSVEEANTHCAFVKGRQAAYKEVLGCQYWAGKVCTVVAPDCAKAGDLKCFGILGHEVKHCFEGAFHS
jgi:hypothetical protein